eukprot:401225_1
MSRKRNHDKEENDSDSDLNQPAKKRIRLTTNNNRNVIQSNTLNSYFNVSSNDSNNNNNCNRNNNSLISNRNNNNSINGNINIDRSNHQSGRNNSKNRNKSIIRSTSSAPLKSEKLRNKRRGKKSNAPRKQKLYGKKSRIVDCKLCNKEHMLWATFQSHLSRKHERKDWDNPSTHTIVDNIPKSGSKVPTRNSYFNKYKNTTNKNSNKNKNKITRPPPRAQILEHDQPQRVIPLSLQTSSFNNNTNNTNNKNNNSNTDNTNATNCNQQIFEQLKIISHQIQKQDIQQNDRMGRIENRLDTIQNFAEAQSKTLTSKREITYMISPSTNTMDSINIFKTLNHYLSQIKCQRFRGIQLNNMMLDSDAIDNSIDFVDWDEMDQKLMEELSSEAIQSGENEHRSNFAIDAQTLAQMDQKLMNHDDVELINNNSVIMCCDGQFCGDKLQIKEQRTIVFCSNEYCNKINHILCLVNDSRVTDVSFTTGQLLKCARGEESFECPDCIVYNQNIVKSLEQVSSIIDSFSHNIFVDRINMNELKESKYYYFNQCLNIIRLIYHAILSWLNNEDFTNETYGVDSLNVLYKDWSVKCPAIFRINFGLLRSHYNVWKDIIWYHISNKDGKLANLFMENDSIKFRDACLKFRYWACNNQAIKMKTSAFWIFYDCGKSMGCSETLVENVGSTENIVLDNRKVRMLETKVVKKVSLQQHYKGDKQKENEFVKAAEPIFREEVGSVCMKDQDAKTFRGVIKKVAMQSKAGTFSLPTMFNKGTRSKQLSKSK